VATTEVPVETKMMTTSSTLTISQRMDYPEDNLTITFIMVIKRIEIKNFKSFSDQNIELGQFNVLVGANASGKFT